MTDENLQTTAKGIQEFYEGCLEKHGANQYGMDWGDDKKVIQRFQTMAELFLPSANAGQTLDIIDVGCGAGLFHDYLNWYHNPLMKKYINYHGIDISPKMIEAAQRKHPGVSFEARDLVNNPLPALSVDYAVVNGVLTVKGEASFDNMKSFAEKLITSVFNSCRRGVAVNFMTKHVDWEKDRLFHLALDEAMQFFKKSLSRHVVFRHDYGLWEYTAYIFRDPNFSECEQDEEFISTILNGI